MSKITVSGTAEEIIIKIDLDDILSKIATDVINEIRRLIDSGKNVGDESLTPKRNGEPPTFYDTGLMLNSITYKFIGGGIEIFVANEGRSLIMDYLNQRHDDWKILDETEYIIDFVDRRLQYYLDEQFPD